VNAKTDGRRQLMDDGPSLVAANLWRPGSAIVIAVSVLAACTASRGGQATTPSPVPRVAASGRHLVVTAGWAGWRLPAPVTRMVALPQPGGALLAGGLDAAGASTGRVSHLNVKTGALRYLGSVPTPFHDAAGAMIGGHAEFFGGGAATTTDTVQQFPGRGAGRGRVVGHLPRPRSDLSAVTVRGRRYLLGGYTGAMPQAAVLSTVDGSTFATVAKLPVTVRYAAVTALGSDIWVFGGEHGTHAVRTIQRIDTTTGRATVVGALPAPVQEAVAVTIRGRILLAGGRSSAGRALRAVDEFMPADGSIRRVARLARPVADAATVVKASTAYLIGGEISAKPVATVQTLIVRSVPTSQPG
jgi:hypothetical protein